MERLRTERPKGLSRSGLRAWGMFFVILGIFGRSILQNRFLGMTEITNDQLLEVIAAAPEAMLFATIAIVLQFVETCAAPIFCLLLVEGFMHTSNAANYMVRVAGVALVSEIPYNLAMSGNLLEFSSRNPVFGMLVCLVLMYLYRYYDQKKASNFLIKVLSTVAAVVWCRMLNIENGICCVILVCVLWAFRKKLNVRNLMAGAAAMVCSLFSLFYMASPMGMLVIHFYNGEKGQENRLITYLFYPVALTVIGVAGALAY